jgi:hypothetical protein
VTTDYEQGNDLARAKRCPECGVFVGHRKSHESKSCINCQHKALVDCSICRRTHDASVIHACE